MSISNFIWFTFLLFYKRKSFRSYQLSFSFLRNTFLHVEFFSIAKFSFIFTWWEYSTKKARCHRVKAKYSNNCNRSALTLQGWYLRKVKYWRLKLFLSKPVYQKSDYLFLWDIFWVPIPVKHYEIYSGHISGLESHQKKKIKMDIFLKI